MPDFHTESWLWFGIVMVMVALRFTSRLLHFKSIFRFQVEDYLMLYVTCAYTVFTVLINICVNTQTNLIDPKDIPYLTPEDIKERTWGAKINIVVEQTMCMVQWGTKACLLLLYHRLTENLVQNMFVKAVGIYVATTYVVMEVLYFGHWCRPFTDYWQTPTDNVQCTTALHHLIVNLSFNLSSDLLIMSIPLPLFLRAHLEIKRKILLCFPFCFGFFSIICAILSKHVSFTHPFSPVWVFWYTREASCVMIVANMPYTWGLARRVFKIKSFLGRGSSASGSDSIDRDATHDTGMEIIGGEMRQINGVVAYTDAGASEEDTRPAWRRLSSKFGGEKKPEKSTPTSIAETKDVSANTSPTVTQSDESSHEKHWNGVDWARENTGAEITHVSTSQSGVSPDSLMPPSPAAFGSSTTRTSTADSRRSSVLGTQIHRMSTLGTKKHGRSTVSEAPRRAARASINVDAVDRLYRLDDEGLIADLEAARPRSRCSGFE